MNYTQNENRPATLPGKEHSPCVLIYDDDVEILFLCKTILERSHYRVETLMNCGHVNSDVYRIKPDVILMDLWVPSIGGEQAVKLLKEDPATQNIAVILFSANNDIEEITHRVKANGYLKKPFDISVFKQIIEKSIRHNKIA